MTASVKKEAATWRRAADRTAFPECKDATETREVTPQPGRLQDLEVPDFLLHTLITRQNYGMPAPAEMSVFLLGDFQCVYGTDAL